MTESSPALPQGPDQGQDHLRRAHDAGEEAVETLRLALARKAARLLRSDPEAAGLAAEMGLLDPRWIEPVTLHAVTR